jgi:hypothetical protein
MSQTYGPSLPATGIVFLLFIYMGNIVKEDIFEEK